MGGAMGGAIGGTMGGAIGTEDVLEGINLEGTGGREGEETSRGTSHVLLDSSDAWT
jgi:hypothetical protein